MAYRPFAFAAEDAQPAPPATLKPPAYDPARLQREADRRNAAAVRAGTGERWCACRRFATFAYPHPRGRDVWRCTECGPPEEFRTMIARQLGEASR
ncbi:hypothetical protein [Methylosinus sp. PW1]|uniref:hypothetical protein n=1 Tax=Methylosinus sp. PW1 TaxID=107636 RepID=UPI00056ACCF1|nr:hypothetical protein [Methylosinus sp. PW1]